VMRLSKWGCLLVAVVLLARGVESVAAVPPSENLMPNNTKGFFAVPSVDQFKEAWNKTQLGQLLNDPLMQPFVESFKEQLRDKWLQTHRKLGLTWQDLDGVPTGEVGLGLVQVSEKEAATVLTADVTGHPEQTQALIAKMHKNLTAQKAVQSRRNVMGTFITVYDTPKLGDIPARQMAYFVRDDEKGGGTLFAAADSAKVLEGILARALETRSDGLGNVPAFAAITKRCKAAAGDLAPHARWFIEPFGYVNAMRINNGYYDQDHKNKTDMLKIFEKEGFDAVEGVGGFVNFMFEKYEMLHRTYVFAPGNKNGERFKLSMRMMKLPNGGEFGPPDWVPRDVSAYGAVNIDVKNAFENSKTLVNEIVGDEVFDDVIESIKTDENGPRIDVRKDLLAYLEDRVVIFSDNQMPITPKSERMVFAVPTNNPEKLAATIKKQMETDEDAKKRIINGHVVWEVVEAEAEDLPMITIENNPALTADGAGKPADEEEEEEKPILPNSAVTVAYGQMFVATHIDILAKVLSDESERGKLSASPDYQRISAEIAKLRLSTQSAEMFTRTDDAYRQVYELLKAGRMPEAESMFGKLLNAFLGEGKEGVLRTQRIDGSKLPEYDLVRRYFGPAGMTVTTEEEGWFMTGLTLNKEAE
jgi:hypothetical protein